MCIPTTYLKISNPNAITKALNIKYELRGQQ